MARMPAAVWLGEHAPQDPPRFMERYDICCCHTIVGFAPAHAAHFSVKADGTILQSRDTMFRSAANLDGNHRIIAIENEDHGPAFPDWTGSNVPALTDAQVEANARILAWCHQEHGIPLQLCPDSRPTSRGLAYHRQGIDGNFTTFPGRVPGGEVWTLTPGKVCPGDRRIAQLPDILRRGEDMLTEDVQTIVTALLDTEVDVGVTVRRALRRAARTDEELAALVQTAVETGIANAVIDVNVNIGTKPEV